MTTSELDKRLAKIRDLNRRALARLALLSEPVTRQWQPDETWLTDPVVRTRVKAAA